MSFMLYSLSPMALGRRPAPDCILGGSDGSEPAGPCYDERTVDRIINIWSDVI